LPPDERERFGMLAPQNVERLMGASPPEAILTGAEDALEEPLVRFATEHKYRQVTLSSGLVLWVRPGR
jgi:hypothetical protein